MIKSFLIIVFIVNLNAEIVDFGVQGKQFKIVEENGNELIQKELKKLDYKKIDKDINDSIEKLKTSMYKIKASAVDSIETTKDLYKAKWDIKDVDGSVLYTKGDYIPTTLSKGVQLELCFVDGSLLKGVVDEIVKTFGNKCKYFINKKNIDLFAKEYGVETYPLGGQNVPYLTRYKIESLPTKIIRIEDKLITQRLSIKRIAISVASGEK
ncbi:hypothetical protein [Sulfurimonas sp.]|uniref:hypothetical protein n=1 Tax=Sulfurimonas sp. TaxID=2022749 RepID=UPI0025CE82B8|nr:hypothetical protein [Sulfurimonas sp.]